MYARADFLLVTFPIFPMELLWFILIGILAGWIASVLMHGHGHGVVMDFLLGIVGAVIGGFVLRFLNITTYGTLGSLAMAVIGAMILLALANLLRRA